MYASLTLKMALKMAFELKSLLTSLCPFDCAQGRLREEWFDRLTMTFVILSLSKDGKEWQWEIF